MPTPHLRRPSGRSRRRLVALLAIPALVAPIMPTAGASPASAEPVDTGPVAAPELASDGAGPVAVTLITGDTVYWRDAEEAQVVEVEEAPRRYPVTFDQYGTRQNFYVIPSDVRESIAAGTVDRELFNVPGLVSQGLDDASSDRLPVIVTFGWNRSDQRLAHDADSLPAASNARVIDEINGAGVKVARDKAASFRDKVLGASGQAMAPADAQGLGGVVERVLLDRALQIDLAQSVPQIGAPEAWGAGFTGEGVRVAVLDTGVDSKHPDLAGQVVAAENFTDEADLADTHGHGTHVASTIVGTGAASEGSRSGVAPGADLLSGKVCTGDGECQTSAIMAGMAWAVSQGADIVNMSLGGGPTNGSDPLSELLNQLSEESGVLFVTSAGNSSCCQQVGTPGAADAALAVGAVSKENQMAWFSSRGPRVGDHAVKPEITAPGVAIEAARAAGTAMGSPVDSSYTAANGTSMASPHVAGAAALLAQSRPNLSGADLKDVLVSTAKDGGFRWYEQGTGRVDIPAALRSKIHAQDTVNFGGIDNEAQKQLTYTNTSGNNIALSLDVQASNWVGQPVEGISLSDDQIIVPARRKLSINVTVSAAAAAATGGPFGGVVVATTSDGNRLRTGIGFGPSLNTVRLDILDSRGQPVGSETAPDLEVILIHDTYDPDQPVGSRHYILDSSDGTAVGHVPDGIYTIFTEVLEHDQVTGELTRGSVLTEVEVAIVSGIHMMLDARDAVPIQVAVQKKADKRNHEVALIREFPKHEDPGTVFTFRAGGDRFPVYATPTQRADMATFALWVHWTLAEPRPVYPLFESPDCPEYPFQCYSETPAYVYNLPFLYEDGIPQSLHEKVTRRSLVLVPTWYHADQPDAYILQQFASIPHTGCTCGNGTTQRIWMTPGRTNEYMLVDDRFTWTRISSQQYRKNGAKPSFLFTQRSRDRFLATEGGARRPDEHWFTSPVRLGVPDSREEYIGNPIGESGATAVASRGGADGNQFVPGLYVMDNARGHLVDMSGFGSWRMWHLDSGTELDGGRGAMPMFPLLAEEAIYRLEQAVSIPASSDPLFRTGPYVTTWKFTSRPSDSEVSKGYTCPIRVGNRDSLCQIQPIIQLEYDLNLDVYNRATAGRAQLVTIIAGHHTRAIDRAPVTSLAVKASFDDGVTWQDAQFVGRPRDTFNTGGYLPAAASYQEFRVLLRIPRLEDTTGYVTLRVSAKDANGGTVDQTIHRAYMLK